MKNYLTTTLVLTAILFFRTASAQTTANMDSVIIRENRLQIPFNQQARNIQVLDQAAIKKLPVMSVNQLLAYAAGVDIRQRGPWGTQADISIDGSTFDQVLVLINGVRMSDPQTGHHTMNIPVPLSAIERIEILHGPAARTYGVNAMAGAINIVTKVPVANSVEVQLYAGSNFEKDTSNGKTYAGWGIQGSATLVGKQQSHTFSIAHDEGTGYRYNTDYRANRLFYQNRIVLNSKNTLSATGGYIANRFGASLFYAAPNDKEATENVQTANASLAWQYKPTARLTITPRISYRYNKDDYIYLRQNPEVYHNVHETSVVTGEVNATYQLKHGTAGAGVEERQESIVSNNLGKHQRNNLGFYGEYRHVFSKRFTAGAGIYINNNSDYGTQVLPGADLAYAWHKDWKFFANAGSGERLPTYTDLYYKGPTNIGNDSLRPEQSTYVEGGVQYQHAYISAQASYAYRHITDFIDWVRASELSPWQPMNYQVVNTRIFSVRGKYDISSHLDWPVNTRLQLTAAYTYLDPKIKAGEGQQTKYTTEALQHQVIAGVQGQLYQKLDISVTARYQQRLNAGDYTLLDARIGYQVRRFNVYADGNNLLNTQYQESGAIPLPGRWLTLGVRYSIH